MAVQPLLFENSIPFDGLEIYANPFMAFGNTIPNLVGTNFFVTSGGPTKQNGYFSYAGDNDYAFTTASYTFTQMQGSWTQSVWFRSTAIRTDGQKIFGMESSQTGTGASSYDKNFYIDKNTGVGRFGVWNTANDRTIPTLAAVDNSRWHHAVFVHTSGYCEGWIDGVLQGTMAFSTDATWTPWIRLGGYRNGSWEGSGDGYFEGDIGIYMLHLKALNSLEIAALYETQKRFYT